jgi:dTDP-4-amino-4,6-dideoxygalactose transaminase
LTFSQSVYPPKKIPVARPRLPTTAALVPYIERIDQARRYSNFGPLCQEFEARLAERVGLDASGVTAVSNATVGLSLGLKAAGARPGTLCVLPSWTFSASVHAAIDAGLTPFFADVGLDGLLTPVIARAAIDAAPASVGAIMPVAVCGQPIDPAPWNALSAESGVPVVIDAAPGFDAATPGTGLSVVSLHATKVLGVGEGGFVMSSEAEALADVRLRANFGFLGSREAKVAATNGKLSEYAAALGLAGLDEWGRSRAVFQGVAQCYRQNLADLPVGLPDGWGPNWISTTCVVRLDDAARLVPVLEALHGASVETRAWWGRGMHTHRAFAEFPRMALPNTERLAETILGLPFYLDMTDDEVDMVCGAIRQGLSR